MAHLTNGAIYYERRVKTGEWEHKFAHLTINYSLDEGDDADELLARARTLVVQHVHQTLRGGKEEPAKAGPVLVAGNDTVVKLVPSDPGVCPDPVVDAGIVVPDELNRGFIIPESFTKPDEELLPRTTLAEALATEIIPPVTNLKAAKRRYTKKVTEAAVDPTPIVSSELVVSSEIVDDFTATAPAATDAELGQALTSAMQRLSPTHKEQSRPMCLSLIGEFVEKGKSYTLIPAVRRGEFLTKLEALV